VKPSTKLNAIVQGPWREYLSYAACLHATQQGKIEICLDQLHPPPASTLISHMLSDLRQGQTDSEAAFAKIEDFFGSDAVRSIPYGRVAAVSIGPDLRFEASVNILRVASNQTPACLRG
jgi:hypothetical protein